MPERAEAADARACANAFDKGQALRHDQKLTAAHEQLMICSDQSCPAMVVKDCAEMLAEVEQSTPSIVFSAKDLSTHDVINVRVLVDGKEIATSLTGAAIAIDPGVHAMHFETAGATPIDRQVVVREGQKLQPIEVQFDSNRPPPRVEPPVNQAPIAPTAEKPNPTIRYAAYGIGGAGIISIAIGSVFGGMASSKWNTAKTECGAGCAPDSPAYASRSDAKSDATVSTITFALGGVLLAGGVTLFVLGPKEKSNVAVSAAPNGLLLRGQF